MAFITVKDMYRIKHPEEFAEKFPEKKEEIKEEDNLTPSERERLNAPDITEEEAQQRKVKTTAELKAELKAKKKK